MKLVTAEYVEKNKIPYIVLFTRNGNQREKRVISGFRPYFYVQSSEGESGSFKSIDGFTVKKIYTETPEDVLQARKMYPRTWEADIRFVSRYLIDSVPFIEKCDLLRIQYVDIETSLQTGEIISIATFDNYLQKCICLVWREDLECKQYDKEYSFPSGFAFKATVHTYDSKIKMLSDYIRFVKESDPDILSGWFSTAFDFKVIIQQINACGLNASSLSPLFKTYMIGEEVSKLESNIKISGRVLWDMLRAYKALQPSRLPDASLEAISQLELKEGKHKHIPFSELWKDIDNLIEYNAKDAVLVFRIDQKKHLIEYFDELRRFIGCEWNSLWYETLLWDVYILRKLHNKLVLPTKQKVDIGEYKGASVFQPPKGIHQNVIVVDLKSLYPTIIMSCNMSPETLLKAPQPNCITLPNGISFKKEPVGILPESLLELLELRKALKEQMKKFPFGTQEYESLDHRQNATKVLMNALYGAMGFKNFRLATPEIAFSVTFIGRNILEFVRKTLEEYDYKIIYGDTDSIFLCAKSNEALTIYEETKELIKELNVKLEQFMKGFCNTDKNYIQIEAKKIYKNLMISERKTKAGGAAKKRYAGLMLWNDGEFLNPEDDKSLDIVGFEQRRSDNSALSRDVQKKVFRLLLGGQTTEILKVYIQRVLLDIKQGNYELEYIGISRGLSQSFTSYKSDNPHLRGSKYSNVHLGLRIGQGDKPKIIYVSHCGKYPKTDVVAFNRNEEVPEDFKVDVETMIDKCVTTKIEHILSVAGLSVEQILGSNSSLEEFF